MTVDIIKMLGCSVHYQTMVSEIVTNGIKHLELFSHITLSIVSANCMFHDDDRRVA